MRILHVVASLAPRHGGPTVAALGMVRAQRALGVDSRLLSSDDDAGARLPVECGNWVEHEGLPVWFLPRVEARQHTLVGFTYTPGIRAWMKKHAGDFDFVHVHTVFSHPANSAMRHCRKHSIPYCVRPLGQLCDWSLKQRRWVKQLQLALITRRNVNAARFIHCTSRMEAEETALNGFTSPCEVLPHGLEMPPIIPDARRRLRERLGLPQDRRLVIFMSRIHPKKGIDLLLQAAARLEPDFDLVFAGSGEEAHVSEARRQADALLGARAHWLGFTEGTEKWTALQGADIFALTSHSENFGIAVAEAVACGLPVLVSNQVALCDEVERLRLGAVTSLDVGDIASALGKLLESPSLRSEIAARATVCAQEHFSWPAAARRLVSACERHLVHA